MLLPGGFLLCRRILKFCFSVHCSSCSTGHSPFVAHYLLAPWNSINPHPRPSNPPQPHRISFYASHAAVTSKSAIPLSLPSTIDHLQKKQYTSAFLILLPTFICSFPQSLHAATIASIIALRISSVCLDQFLQPPPSNLQLQSKQITRFSVLLCVSKGNVLFLFF